MLKRRVRMIGTTMALNAHAVSAVKQFRITTTLIIRNIQRQLNILTKHNSKILWREIGHKAGIISK
jgi:hypothetical protein